MSGWKNSDRRRRLPNDWRHRREQVLRRDPVCRACDTRASTDVDHVRAGDDHGLENLQGLCRECHQKKTVQERPASQRRRPPEAHPGLT